MLYFNVYQDTIAAISTPLGEGGIGIVRVSGPQALPILRQLYVDRRRLPVARFTSHRLHYGFIVDPATAETVDEVLVSYMRAPHTYTREDVVEINCHGGPLPLQRTLELTLAVGARLAQPGEMTLRAFLNGRLDLAQAEAVLDVIRAKTEAGLRVAMRGLGGQLSAQVKELRARLMDALAYLTALIDFPEDEVEAQDIFCTLQDGLTVLAGLLATADAGIIYRQGVRAAIVGRPNVGKSSLLNCLLRDNRAIVTSVPGTTRDTLEEVVNIRGVPFVLIDTAGIRESDDLVERLGVERSRTALERADVALAVVDVSESLTIQDRAVLSLLNGKPAVVVANKVDRGAVAKLSDPRWPVIYTSTVTGQGLADLERIMVEKALGGEVSSSDALLVSNPRHKDALHRASQHLAGAIESLRSAMPADFVSIDLTAAINCLGEITGETVGEDLLETIFSNFCVGK